MKKVAVIMADGFEEMEAINTIDILRRASINVEIIALNNIALTGAHDITIHADEIFDYYCLLDFDAIIFVGGMANANSLASNNKVIELIDYYYKSKKLVCGICATPAVVFSKTNILDGKQFTCYPVDDLIGLVKNAEFVDKAVVVCDNVITSQSPYSSMAYALTIVKELGYDIDELQNDLKG